MTQPAAIANRFVFYAAGAGGLNLVALNARSGSTAWSKVASPSVIAPGEPPGLMLIDGNVIYLRKVTGQVAELAAADPVTGRDVWHGEPGAFTTWPVPCPTDPETICTTGTLASFPVHSSLSQVDARTGAVLSSVAIPTGGRALSEGLFDPGTRNPEKLLKTDEGKASWAEPLAHVFTVPRASTDWGWDIDRDGRSGVFVGSVGVAPLTFTRSRFTSDLGKPMVAGFRISDGSVVWRDPGAEYVCDELPCPGSTQAGFYTGSPAQMAGPTVGVSLRATGTLTGSPTSSAPATVSKNARASLQGFDPATGRVLWRYDTAQGTGIVTLAALPPQVGGTTIVLADRRGTLHTLDLANGSEVRTTSAAPAWCRTLISYTESVPYASAGRQPDRSYVGQPSLYPCTSDMRRAPAPNQIPAFVGALGAEADGLVAWSESKGVIAAPR